MSILHFWYTLIDDWINSFSLSFLAHVHYTKEAKVNGIGEVYLFTKWNKAQQERNMLKRKTKTQHSKCTDETGKKFFTQCNKIWHQVNATEVKTRDHYDTMRPATY